MEKDDRVILLNKHYYEHKGEIIEIHYTFIPKYSASFKVRVFNTLNVNHKNIETWVNENEIKKDIEYHRDLAINKILQNEL
jgi:hypothetical protein